MEGRKIRGRRDVGEGLIAIRGRGKGSCGIESGRTGGVEKTGKREVELMETEGKEGGMEVRGGEGDGGGDLAAAAATRGGSGGGKAARRSIVNKARVGGGLGGGHGGDTWRCGSGGGGGGGGWSPSLFFLEQPLERERLLSFFK